MSTVHGTATEVPVGLLTGYPLGGAHDRVALRCSCWRSAGVLLRQPAFVSHEKQGDPGGVSHMRDTMCNMERVTVRELRNNGGRVLDRVAAGERVVVTRDGVVVAELAPASGEPLDAQTLLDRWRHLPVIDADRFRTDVDAALDAGL